LPLFLRFADETKKTSALVIPPLLLGRASDAESSTTWVLNTYYSSREDGHTLASIPLVFSRSRGDEHDLLIPPLLTYHGGDGKTERTLVANTYMSLGPEGWSFAFAPLVFAGRDGTDAHTIAFPLVWRFADADASTTVVGPLLPPLEREGRLVERRLRAALVQRARRRRHLLRRGRAARLALRGSGDRPPRHLPAPRLRERRDALEGRDAPLLSR
jgi:hypothetical protein